MSEHLSCVLPRDDRFPCPFSDSDAAFAQAGAALYTPSGACEVSGCVAGEMPPPLSSSPETLLIYS
jgi:hypothetical protein